ncbi:hypothetical protein TNCV_4397231 [Trichonephila clavipes]|nr:hypothetical protein TNCV_4397231 [Trichonephila clavipes]
MASVSFFPTSYTSRCPRERYLDHTQITLTISPNNRLHHSTHDQTGNSNRYLPPPASASVVPSRLDHLTNTPSFVHLTDQHTDHSRKKRRFAIKIRKTSHSVTGDCPVAASPN